MTNETFELLTEDEKQTKLRAVLNAKTNGCLTEGELRDILLAVSLHKFTVEEINLMCVFEGQDRTGMIADIKNVIPHIQDSDMVELAGQVLGKLEAMSDAEFAEVALEAAE